LLTSDEVTSEPVWFGQDNRPLFGWIHYPLSRQVRGGVILCSSLGIESEASDFVFRQFADQLARKKFIVLRFDYDGTGNSAGSHNDPDRLNSWISSIHSAVQTLQQTGVSHLSVVGIRMGALLSMVEQNRHGLFQNIVLWDPYTSGRNFMRQQRLLRSLVGTTVGYQNMKEGEILGVAWSEETIKQLDSLHLADLEIAKVRRALILSRSENRLSDQLQKKLSDSRVTWDFVNGQSQLFDSPLLSAKIHQSDLLTIINWLCLDQPTWQILHQTWTSGNIAHRLGIRTSVIEQALTFPPDDTFCIVTRSREVVTRNGNTIIFLNAGNLHHVGPARQWVELGRNWADHGFQCVRIDLPGLGESRKAKEGDPKRNVEDIELILMRLCDRLEVPARSIILVGLCSGANQAIAVAEKIKLAGIIAINPSVRSQERRYTLRLLYIWRRLRIIINKRKSVGVSDRRTRDYSSQDNIITENNTQKLSLLQIIYPERLVRFVHGTLNSASWRIINTVLYRRKPIEALIEASKDGTRVLVLASLDDVKTLNRGNTHRYDGQQENDTIWMVGIPSLDHNFHFSQGRDAACKVMNKFLSQCVTDGHSEE